MWKVYFTSDAAVTQQRVRASGKVSSSVWDYAEVRADEADTVRVVDGCLVFTKGDDIVRVFAAGQYTYLERTG